MNKFKYTKKSSVIATGVIIISVCSLGVIMNVVSIIKNAYYFPKTLPFIILLSICVFILLNVITFMTIAGYTITDEHLIVSYGIFNDKVPVKNITAATIFTKTNTLVIYYGEHSFFIAVIKREQYDDFVKCLRTKNPEITYDITSEPNVPTVK